MSVITNDINYGLDFVRQDESRFFIIGTPDVFYLMDRITKLVTVLKAGFTGTLDNRWQSDIINDNLILVNGQDPIQTFDGTILTALVAAIGDTQMPQAAKFVLNSIGHLVLASTTEGGGLKPFRVRWSDIGDQTVWTNASTNEAGYEDVTDVGDIMGLAALGTFSFVVYGQKGIYRFDYVGLPFIYAKYRVVTDIGVIAPYSLVATQDNHYFLGEDGFYEYSGSGAPVRIGLDPQGRSRVDAFILKDFDVSNPNRMFGFAHPEFPEIWWVYQSSEAKFFNRAIVYSWQDRVWTIRDPLPFSMLATILLSQGLEWNQANFAWNNQSAKVSWASLSQLGEETVISGD